jgi:hypothetical protein
MAKSKASKKSARKAKGAKRASKRVVKRAARKAARKAVKRSAKRTAKPAKPAKKGASTRAASRGSRKTAKRAAKPASRRGAVKVPRKAAKPVKSVPKLAARPAGSKSPAVVEARKAPARRTAAASGKKPNLDRDRRTVREEEEMVPSPPSSLDMDRHGSAARTGRAEFEERLRLHTSTGPSMTGGDVDADWEDAESVGDQAPGGDNPTPDQDIVDEIGKAMGIQYDDDEELQGGDELAERDRHRWELDPASKDDFEED